MADISVGVNISMGDLLKKMKALPERVQKNIVVGAVRASAKPMIAEARRSVAVDTGDLKKSIGVNRRKSKDKNEIIFSVSPRKGGKYDGWHGHLQEFGTINMAAHPFMRPAYEKQGKGSIEAVRAYMKKRVEKEVAKL